MTASDPLWTIAILTIPGRRMEYTRIRAMLNHQLREWGPEKVDVRPRVEIMVNDREYDSIAAKRQQCLENANGRYFNFIDDDDLIAHDYVASILPLLDGEVDHIGFKLQHYLDGVRSKPTFHSIRYETWYDDENGYYRNTSHLNPMRIEVALQGRFDGYYGEDFRWSQQVRPLTEHFIDKTLYHYYDAPKYSAARAASPGRLSAGGHP